MLYLHERKYCYLMWKDRIKELHHFAYPHNLWLVECFQVGRVLVWPKFWSIDQSGISLGWVLIGDTHASRGNSMIENKYVWIWLILGSFNINFYYFLPYMVWWHPVTSLFSFSYFSILDIWIDYLVDWEGFNLIHPSLDYL